MEKTKTPAKRNPVALALALRGTSGAAGAHRKGIKAERQAAQASLRKEVSHA